jgi:hypothetical protein
MKDKLRAGRDKLGLQPAHEIGIFWGPKPALMLSIRNLIGPPTHHPTCQILKCDCEGPFLISLITQEYHLPGSEEQWRVQANNLYVFLFSPHPVSHMFLRIEASEIPR